jgi:hypothetical protein
MYNCIMKFDATNQSNTQGVASSSPLARGRSGGGSVSSDDSTSVVLPDAITNNAVRSTSTTVSEQRDPSMPRDDDADVDSPTGKPSELLSPSPSEGEGEPEPKRHHDGIARSNDLDKKLSEVRSNEEELLTKQIASNWNMKYIDLAGVTVETDALVLVPQRTASEAHAAPFKVNNKQLSVAIENPNNVSAQAVINSLIRDGYTVTTYMVSPRSMGKLINRYADIRQTTGSHGGMVDMDETRIATISERIHKNADIQAVINELLDRPREQGVTSELLEIIMGSAIATNLPTSTSNLKRMSFVYACAKTAY